MTDYMKIEVTSRFVVYDDEWEAIKELIEETLEVNGYDNMHVTILFGGD